MSKILIKDLEPNKSISSYFGLFQKSVRVAKNDKPYLDLILCDKSGKINAKMWDNVNKVKDKINEGDPVAVKASSILYQHKIQLKIFEIRKVDEEEDKKFGYDIADLIKSSDKNVEEMWNTIVQMIDTIENKHIQDIVKLIYKNYEKEIKEYPAAMYLHHSFRNGLLEHTYNMIRNGDSICKIYPEANRDFVLAGILLHDIGKIRELDPGIAINYSDEGNFVGHLVIGRDILLEMASQLPDFPDELKIKLGHIILAHQGKLEWASPREPMFLEAMLVFHIDEMDTRVSQIQTAIEKDESDGNWTTRQNYFGRILYKGKV